MDQNKKIMLAGGIVLILAFGLFFGLPKIYENGKEQVLESRADESIASTYASLSPQAQKLYMKQSDGLTKPVPERLVELDELKIGCFGPQNVMQMSTADGNLGGQCCGVLTDIEAYEVQLEALERFIEENGNIDLIPRDPYDMPVEQAQQLTSFDQLSLTVEQQSIYDKAMKMSHHGGPCCCKCWKWYVMSGLAKKLIVDYGWDENQIAELWDTSSSCGHKHDTNMHEHYNVAEGEETGHSHSEHSHQESHDHGSMEILDVESTIFTGSSSVQVGEQTKITFQLKEDGEPITGLVEHHARKLHVVVISKNLEIFGHIHPEDFNYDNTAGEYSVDFIFPKSGKYLVAIDGMTNEGKFSEQFVINVEGSPKQDEMHTNYNIKSNVDGNAEDGTDKVTKPIVFSEFDDGEYEIILNASKLQQGKETTLSFTILKNGAPLNDLTNYLDAPIHFAIVKDDFSDFMHEHGTLPGGEHDAEAFGPTLELKTTFMNSGIYQLVGQVKHESKIIVFPFTIRVVE